MFNGLFDNEALSEIRQFFKYVECYIFKMKAGRINQGALKCIT